jgi:hypothetical protein
MSINTYALVAPDGSSYELENVDYRDQDYIAPIDAFDLDELDEEVASIGAESIYEAPTFHVEGGRSLSGHRATPIRPNHVTKCQSVPGLSSEVTVLGQGSKLSNVEEEVHRVLSSYGSNPLSEVPHLIGLEGELARDIEESLSKGLNVASKLDVQELLAARIKSLGSVSRLAIVVHYCAFFKFFPPLEDSQAAQILSQIGMINKVPVNLTSVDSVRLIRELDYLLSKKSLNI